MELVLVVEESPDSKRGWISLPSIETGQPILAQFGLIVIVQLANHLGRVTDGMWPVRDPISGKVSEREQCGALVGGPFAELRQETSV